MQQAWILQKVMVWMIHEENETYSLPSKAWQIKELNH